MMKKLFAGMVFFILLTVGMVSYAQDEIRILVNDKELKTDVATQIIAGRTLLPVRAVFEFLGAEVEYDSETNTVTGTKGNVKIVLRINDRQAIVNDKPVTLEVPAILIEDRTFVPVRFIAESLDMNVSWVENTKTILINDKRQETYTDIATTALSPEAVKPSPFDIDDREEFMGKAFEAQRGKVVFELEIALRNSSGFRLYDAAGEKMAFYLRSDNDYDSLTQKYTTYVTVCDEYGIDTGNHFYQVPWEVTEAAPRINLTVVADVKAQRADIYMDGKLLAENQEFLEAVENLGICAYWDSSAAAVNGVETVDGETLETRETVFKTAERNLAGTLVGLERKIDAFEPQFGRVIVDIDIDYGNSTYFQIELLDAKGEKAAVKIVPDGGHMRVENLMQYGIKTEYGSGFRTFGQFSALDKSYLVHLRIVADVAAQKADIYLNGELTLEKMDFYEPVENVGRCETHGNIQLTGVKR